MTDQEKQNRKWHMGREFNLSIVFGILFQTGVIIWWASGTDRHVNANDERITQLEKATQAKINLLEEITDKNFQFQVNNRQRVFDQLNALRNEVQENKVGIARVEGGIANANKSLDRLIAVQFNKDKAGQ